MDYIAQAGRPRKAGGVDFVAIYNKPFNAADYERARAVAQPDPLIDLADAMASFGLSVKGAPIIDGKIHRVPEINSGKASDDAGRYVVHELGNGLIFAHFWNWRSGDKGQWSSKTETLWSPADRAAVDRARGDHQEAQEQAHREAAAEAEALWGAALPAPADALYLARKGIRAHGIRFHGGNLVVPVLDSAGAVMSVQLIDSAGDKRFLPGGKVAGCHFKLDGNPAHGVFVCEGFATGASVAEATGGMVYVAFNAGNLDAVTAIACQAYRNVTVAGDDDRGTAGNPGRTKAESAAKKHGCKVVFPRFADLDGNPTDFNDLAAREGMPAVAACLVPSSPYALPLVWASEIVPDLQHSYIIKGLLDVGAMSVVYGQSNTGKSFFAIDLAAHVAAGMSWREKRVVAGGVVYVAAESGASVQRRVWAWCREHGLPDIPLAVIPAAVDLLDPNADIVRLIETVTSAGIDRQRISLIVIDTLSRAFGGGDENSSQDMTGFVRNMDRVRGETGAHVMTVHHAGKDDARGARGHSSLRAATDTEISIRRAEGAPFSVASIDKQRDGQSGDKLPFELKEVTLGVDQDGDPMSTCVAVPVDMSAAYGGEKLNDRQKRARSALIQYWLTSKPAAEGITFPEFAEIMYSAGILDEDSPRVRSDSTEFRGALQKKGIIRVANRRVVLLMAPAAENE